MMDDIYDDIIPKKQNNWEGFTYGNDGKHNSSDNIDQS